MERRVNQLMVINRIRSYIPKMYLSEESDQIEMAHELLNDIEDEILINLKEEIDMYDLN